jgi:predicted nucleotidyltransferase
MNGPFPNSIPEPHRHFLVRLLERLKSDSRIVGVAAGGSYLTDSMDAFSDLDLVIAVEPVHLAEVMAERRAIADSLGPLLAAFTGEHVGEPRLLICLYDAPLLHVDLKFVSLEDVAERVEDPAILWERDRRLAAALTGGTAEYPLPDPQWIDDRFWIWIHYVATKIGRGELFEAIDGLAFLRARVLAPLALLSAGGRPAGVRKVEMAAPTFARDLRQTVAAYDAPDCLRALRACAELYKTVRPLAIGTSTVTPPEKAAIEYLSAIGKQDTRSPR